MSLSSHGVRRALAAASIAALAACAAAAPAQAAQLTQTYKCTYPLIGERGLTVNFNASISGQSDPSVIATTANAEADLGTYHGFDLMGVDKVSGVLKVTSTVTAPNFLLPLQFSMTIPEVTMPAAPPLRFEGLTGATPALTFNQQGTVSISVDRLDLNIAAQRADGSAIVLPPVVPVDSDGNPNTFDVPCVLDPPGQPRNLPPIDITPPQTRVAGLTGMATGWDAAELSWDALEPVGGDVVTGYEVYQDGVKVQTVPGTSAAITGLDDSTVYAFKVRAAYESGGFSGFSDEVEILTNSDETEPVEPPGEPYIQSVSDVTSTSIQLYWGASSDDRLAGYEIRVEGKVYDVGNVTSHKLRLGCDAAGQAFEIDVRAYSKAGTYSDYSESIIIETPLDAYDPPGPVKGLAATAAGKTAVDLTWAADDSGDCIAFGGYEVFRDGVRLGETWDRSYSVDGLAPGTTYAFKVRLITAPFGIPGPFSDEVRVTTDSDDATVSYGFDIAGTSALRTLTRGTVPISGRLDPELVVATGAFSGDLELNRTRARLQVLGLIPVTADIAFAQTDRVRGSLVAGRLSAQARFKIRLPQLYLFGVLPLTPQDTCQTRSTTVAQLASPDGFDPLRGGRLTGTYGISDLTGCGLLESFLSPLTKGGGNTLDLTLTPRDAPL